MTVVRSRDVDDQVADAANSLVITPYRTMLSPTLYIDFGEVILTEGKQVFLIVMETEADEVIFASLVTQTVKRKVVVKESGAVKVLAGVLRIEELFTKEFGQADP